MPTRYKVRKGDQIEVLAGKEKGKRGKIIRVDRKHDRVLVEKLNFRKRHMRPGHPTAPQGGIMESEGPLDISNVMLVCPKCQKTSRPKFMRLDNGTTVRVCKKCEEHID